MKTRLAKPAAIPAPTEAEVRDLAYHLYEQSGCTPGRDLDNWLEASAVLQAPPSPAGHVQPGAEPAFGAPTLGHVQAAAGHARDVHETAAHVGTQRHS